jgi:hypothetical protein
MNLRNVLIGLIFILLGVWTYTALSTFKIEEDSDPARIIIREGVIRTEDEVAEKLAKDMGFDLEGAYKTGYTSMHIVEYLIKEPHEYPVTFYNGKYHEGRKTVLYLIPFSICIFLVLIGVGIILSKGKSKKA